MINKVFLVTFLIKSNAYWNVFFHNLYLIFFISNKTPDEIIINNKNQFVLEIALIL